MDTDATTNTILPDHGIELFGHLDLLGWESDAVPSTFHALEAVGGPGLESIQTSLNTT